MTFDLLPSSQVNEVDHGCPGHALTCFIGRLLDEGDGNNSVSSTKKKKFSCNYMCITKDSILLAACSKTHIYK